VDASSLEDSAFGKRDHSGENSTISGEFQCECRMNKAIFIDRDGTFIEDVGYLKMLEDLRFTPRAVNALQIFHELGYLNIVITNQSAVARGILSPKELNKIHQKMKNLTKDEGGIIDDIFYCPHLLEGRIAPYNIDCECRKPKIGLLMEAVQKHKLNLEECVMVGDKKSDLELAKNAGIRGILVLTGYGMQTKNEWEGEVESYPTLYDFASKLNELTVRS
jgi:D-glycero-D-manno-heptose 1,7-bisphosphate phosphatase